MTEDEQKDVLSKVKIRETTKVASDDVMPGELAHACDKAAAKLKHNAVGLTEKNAVFNADGPIEKGIHQETSDEESENEKEIVEPKPGAERIDRVLAFDMDAKPDFVPEHVVFSVHGPTEKRSAVRLCKRN